MEITKPMPSAVEVEEVVLGSMLIDKNVPALVLQTLKPDDFYNSANKYVFEAIYDLFKEGEAIDIITVTERVKKNKKLEIVGGPYYITQLTNRVGSTVNIEAHCKILSQMSISRSLIELSSKTMDMCYDSSNDPLELATEVERHMLKIFGKITSRKTIKLGDIAAKVVKQIESRTDNELTGVSTGIAEIDHLTGGFQSSDLIVIAGRPGMGKTALVNTFIKNISIEQKIPSVLFSLEMNKEQQMQRELSMVTKIPLYQIRLGRPDEDKMRVIAGGMDKIIDSPIYINDTPGINLMEIRSEAYRLKMLYDIKIVFIDYLQLIGEEKGRRVESQNLFIGNISKNLKTLARELDIPVVLLSQLNRAVEGRGDKRPQQSDLRDSGSVEQDADIIVFPFRPHYYYTTQKLDSFAEFSNGESTEGKAEIIFSKNRNGAIKNFIVNFDEEITYFRDEANLPY